MIWLASNTNHIMVLINSTDAISFASWLQVLHHWLLSCVFPLRTKPCKSIILILYHDCMWWTIILFVYIKYMLARTVLCACMCIQHKEHTHQVLSYRLHWMPTVVINFYYNNNLSYNIMYMKQCNASVHTLTLHYNWSWLNLVIYQLTL